MAALSFNSQNLTSKSTGKKLLASLLVIAVFVLGAVGGYMGNNKAQAMKASQVNKAGAQYVSAILAGDFDRAYAMSSSELQKNQTKDEFTKSLQELQTSNISLTDEQVAFSNKGVSYSAVASNLKPDQNGATDGIFTVVLVDENGWKAKAVDVE